mmetsp:Transcript_7395/g.9671  ORF Transcript_7395/g.9671 Transcript_7395/m.9671 type:complete len:156 (+) Transcript_7395:186-653(+)
MLSERAECKIRESSTEILKLCQDKEELEFKVVELESFREASLEKLNGYRPTSFQDEVAAKSSSSHCSQHFMGAFLEKLKILEDKHRTIQDQQTELSRHVETATRNHALLRKEVENANNANQQFLETVKVATSQCFPRKELLSFDFRNHARKDKRQ